MCGIFALLNQTINKNIIANFEKGRMRGPENSQIENLRALRL